MRVELRFPIDEAVPEVGSSVETDVAGGREYVALGCFTAGRIEDDEVVMTFEFAEERHASYPGAVVGSIGGDQEAGLVVRFVPGLPEPPRGAAVAVVPL